MLWTYVSYWFSVLFFAKRSNIGLCFLCNICLKPSYQFNKQFFAVFIEVEPVHKIVVIIAYVSKEVSDETAQIGSLARVFAAYTHSKKGPFGTPHPIP